MKRYLSVSLVLLLLLGMLTGCGAKNAMTEQAAPAAGAPMATEAVMEEVLYDEAGSGISNTATAMPENQKLIRTVNIDAETEDLETLLGSLTSQISALGGYIEQQELYNGSSYSSYRHRSANLTVRIPAEKLDSFIGQVKDVSNVVSYNGFCLLFFL